VGEEVARANSPSYTGQGSNPIPLAEIMHSLKGYTARRANQALGRQGPFWQGEDYDHAARDAEELYRIIQYVIHNPVKAGLTTQWKNWRWTFVSSNL
jgi:putative transposase